MNHWIETVWHLPKRETETLSELLDQNGCLGSFEPMGLLSEDEALRTQSDLRAYFADTDVEVLQKKLHSLATDTIKLVSLERIPQAEWATEWRKYFKPFFLTPEIVIRPSWEKYAPVGAEKVVTLDPGMAFGTGQHDTTRFCSELLCEMKTQYPQLESVIDVGCGSGILSIIAKTIGYSNVTGIDNDPAAIETANENLERNPDVGAVKFIFSDGSLQDLPQQKSDVVVANIIAETLAELRDDLVSLAKPGGYLILSGILPERAHLVTTAFAALELVNAKKSKDWHAYVYRR